MTDRLFHTSADTMLKDNLTFLGEKSTAGKLTEKKSFSQENLPASS